LLDRLGFAPGAVFEEYGATRTQMRLACPL